VIRRMESGPLDDFLSRMEEMGVQPEVIQMLGEVSQMDRKHFDQGIMAGEIPMIDLPETHPKITTAIQEKMAETERLKAEAELILAKIEEIRANIMLGHEKNMIEMEKAKGQQRAQEIQAAQKTQAAEPKKESK